MRVHRYSAYWIIFEIAILVIVGICLSTLSYGETEKVTINTDKTYEQCEREAFERLYEQINKSLDEVVENTRRENNDYIQEKVNDTKDLMGKE